MISRIWTPILLALAATSVLAWFVALMHERNIRPAKDWVDFFRRRSSLGRIVLAAFFVGMWIYPPNYPDDETDGTHFVFVHGYNVNYGGWRLMT